MKYQTLDEWMNDYTLLKNKEKEAADEIERTDLLMEISEMEDLFEDIQCEKNKNTKNIKEYMW